MKEPKITSHADPQTEVPAQKGQRTTNKSLAPLPRTRLLPSWGHPTLPPPRGFGGTLIPADDNSLITPFL